MSNSSIFRKVSLERLSSPEQLDELMHVTNPRSWLALMALGVLLGVGLVWSIVAELPTTATGDGVITATGATPQAILYVTENDSKRIKAGQTVHLTCSCAQPSADGLILGTVRSVDADASTLLQMSTNLSNQAVALALAGRSEIVAVQVDLMPDTAAVSGVKWTKENGPATPLKPGFSVSGDITTALQRPIELIIPVNNK